MISIKLNNLPNPDFVKHRYNRFKSLHKNKKIILHCELLLQIKLLLYPMPYQISLDKIADQNTNFCDLVPVRNQ